MYTPEIKQVIYANNDTTYQITWEHVDEPQLSHFDIYETFHLELPFTKIGAVSYGNHVGGLYSFIDLITGILIEHDGTVTSNIFERQHYYKIIGVYNDGSSTLDSILHRTMRYRQPEIMFDNLFRIIPYEINDIIAEGTYILYKGTENNRRETHLIDISHDDSIEYSDANYETGDIYIADFELNSLIPNLSVNPLVLTFEWRGISKTFNITSNENWTITDNVDWITYNQTTGTGNDIITVDPSSFAVRGGDGQREVSIVITTDSGINKVIDVWQFNKYEEAI